jgi:hypothetical protein
MVSTPRKSVKAGRLWWHRASALRSPLAASHCSSIGKAPSRKRRWEGP